MGLSFEVELRRAEATINRLIKECTRNGGNVYISNRDGYGFSAKLTEPIGIMYYMPIEKVSRED